MEEPGVPAPPSMEEGKEAEGPPGREGAEPGAGLAASSGCDLAVTMERALNTFFEPLVEEGLGPGGPQPPEHEGTAQEEKTPKAPPTVEETCIDVTTKPVEVVSTSNNIEGEKLEDDGKFSIITWNIDGLDQSNPVERARGVCSYLADYNPDIIFLQEVIPQCLCYLEKKAVGYNIIAGNDKAYFTAIMLKTSKVKLISQQITPFPASIMMRNLLIVHVNVSGNNLCLMTSHLESMRDHAPERLKQLKVVLKKMSLVPESSTVLFAGDTNLRDHEVANVGGLPKGIIDIWQFLGRPEHCRYTWDTTLNDNLGITHPCRLRFDRIFLRAATNGVQFVPRTLGIIGTTKLKCGRFPSDHWGLRSVFDVIL